MLVPRTFSCYFVSSILVISNLSFGRVECYGALRALKVKFWDVLGYKMNPEQIFRSADAVCFDVDSTLFTTEAIDELADYLNKQDDVKNVTKQAMSGQVGLRPALLARLDIMKPSLSTMRRFIEERPAMLSPGVE
ncbi:phosphoserine phosphatase-like [Diaphorina citri]|nr:phosphoserine phosphatase-like [Diaphorina citri]